MWSVLLLYLTLLSCIQGSERQGRIASKPWKMRGHACALPRWGQHEKRGRSMKISNLWKKLLAFFLSLETMKFISF